MSTGDGVWRSLVVFVVFFGVSMGARGPIVSTIAATLFAGRGLGTIYGTITTGQGLGAAVGSWLAGYLHDLTGGYDTGFALSAGFAVAAITLFWTVPELAARRTRPGPTRPSTWRRRTSSASCPGCMRTTTAS